MRAAILITVVCTTLISNAAKITISLSPQTASVGDVIEVSIHVDGADADKIHYPVTDGGDFVLLKVDSSSAATGTLNFHYAIYDTGSYTLPSMPVVIFNGAVAETLMTEPKTVSIQSVVSDTASAIRANKPNLEHPFRWKDVWKEYKGLIIASLAILLAAGLLWWWLSKRKKITADGIVEEVLLLPHDEAIRSLMALKEKKLPERGLMKEFYLEFSEIIRRYIERRYAIPALEMTTYDLEREFEQVESPSILTNFLLPTLREGDLVKFAKFIPRLETCTAALELGFRVVDETKERDEVPAMEAKAA